MENAKPTHKTENATPNPPEPLSAQTQQPKSITKNLKFFFKFTASIHFITLLALIVWVIYSNKNYISKEFPWYELVSISSLASLPAIYIKDMVLNETNKQYLKKNAIDTPATHNDDPKDNNPLAHAKYLLSLSPIAVSLSFVLVFLYYKDTLKGNMGLAVQITSLQFTQNYHIWIATSLLILTVIYLVALPGILLRHSSKIGTQLIFNKQTIHRYEKWNSLYRYSCALLFLFSIISTLPLYFIFNLLDSELTNKYLAASISFMFFIGMSSIGHSIQKTIKPQETIQLIDENRNKLSHSASAIYLVALIYALIGSQLIIQILSPGLGNSISNPGSSVTKPETPYSCVFLGDRQHPEPKAFGIIIYANASSIHIFKPSYDQKTQTYDRLENNNLSSPNNITETHLTIKKDYYFEKYNSSKHIYNPKTGACEYITQNPSLANYSPLSSSNKSF